MMPFKPEYRWAWVFVTAALTAFAFGALASSIGERRAENLRPIQTPLGEWDTDPAVWGRSFPREYHSWLGIPEDRKADIGYGTGKTKWGGDRNPLDRTPSTGALYTGTSIAGTPGQIKHPISCANCHDPKTLELRVSQPAFLEAMTKRGLETSKVSHQEMRTYVCAQCHATSSLGKEDGRQMIPWSKSATIENAKSIAGIEGIISTYQANGASDWTHPLSGTPLVKLRRPEFELWSQGIHAYRGVSCVDCHMPYRSEGNVRITSHSTPSPLLGDISVSCAVCHRWSEKELRSRVESIQDKTAELQERAGKALLEAHKAVGECAEVGVPEDRLKELRNTLREAQIRWDFIASERSTGFHAPQEAARILGIAIDEARRAESLALKLRMETPSAVRKTAKK